MVTKETRRLVAIVGPTASGKTAKAAKLAVKFDGEIISADSRQVYRGMDLGTGKEKNLGVPQYLVDLVSPEQQFTVWQYQKLAYQVIEDIFRRGKVPFLVGGSGLYVDAVLKGLTIPAVPPDPKLRTKLEQQSNEDLLNELKLLDPKIAEVIDAHNKRRLVRALEVIYTTGRPMSDQQQIKRPSFKYLIIGIDLPREELYQKIDRRLKERLQAGLVDEVKRLHRDGLSYQRLEQFGLEYKYVAAYLQGKLGYDEMVEKLKYAIHAFARRQLTWFRANKEIRWSRNEKESETFISDFLK